MTWVIQYSISLKRIETVLFPQQRTQAVRGRFGIFGLGATCWHLEPDGTYSKICSGPGNVPCRTSSR